MTNNMDKHTLRLAYKARRQAMCDEDVTRRAKALTHNILSLPAYTNAKTIMAYLAMPKEANLDALIQHAIEAGKSVYVPICTTKTTMIAAKLASLDDVTTGVLNIRIPKEGYETIEPTELDLILVPGVAFDEQCGRLGMGAGYYDRFLADVPKARCIGVGWDIQVSEESLPMNSYDKHLGGLVTDCRIKTF